MTTLSLDILQPLPQKITINLKILLLINWCVSVLDIEMI